LYSLVPLRKRSGVDYRVRHLQWEVPAVLDAAAEVVVVLAGAIANEVIEQVALSVMQLDAVEAGELIGRWLEVSA